MLAMPTRRVGDFSPSVGYATCTSSARKIGLIVKRLGRYAASSLAMVVRLRFSRQVFGRVWALVLLASVTAGAAPDGAMPGLPPPSPASDRAQGTDYQPSFWLSDPRIAAPAGEPDLMRFEVHGEYQVRGEGLTTLRLSDYGRQGVGDTLGQSHRLRHYMRWTPVLTYRTHLRFVAQLDVPTGLALGQHTKDVQLDYDPLNDRQPMALSPRWLYAEFTAKYGAFRIGQQPATWGSGLLFNSGDERLPFGDPRGGTIVERISWKGRPLGGRSHLQIFLASDLVFADTRTRLVDGDIAVQSMAGASYVAGSHRRLGLLVLGQERRPNVPDRGAQLGKPEERTVTFDVAGSWDVPVPGQAAHVFAEGEFAQVFGVNQTGSFGSSAHADQSNVRRYGVFARVGAVSTRGAADHRWGRFGVSLEWAWASTDSNANDNADTRFVFEPNRRAGLVLFDEVMRWKSARAAMMAQEAAAGFRAPRDIASQGGLYGATYIAPSVLFRPHPHVDLRGSFLVAQSTGDLSDPVRMRLYGECKNYDGGDCHSRDLGMEVDAGVEYRQPLEGGTATSVGAQAGLLVPGHAFDDANHNKLRNQSVVMGRFGFYL
jgi:hypothetical protein